VKVSLYYRPLVLPSVLLLLFIASFLLLGELIGREHRLLQQVYETQYGELKNRYRQLTDMQQTHELVNRYYAPLQEAHVARHLSLQSRVDWIDRLMRVASDYSMQQASFVFSSRTPLEISQLPNLVNFAPALQFEYLELTGNFQHEMAAIDFVAAIQREVNDLAILDECRLMSLIVNKVQGAFNSHYAFKPDGANIRIQCRFMLLTFTSALHTNAELGS